MDELAAFFNLHKSEKPTGGGYIAKKASAPTGTDDF